MKTFLKWSWVVLSNLVGIVIVPIPIVLMTLVVWAVQIVDRDRPLINTWRVFLGVAITTITYQVAWARGELS
jgi:hypothetical protein